MSIKQENKDGKRIVVTESDQSCFPHSFTYDDLVRNQHGTQKGIVQSVCSTCRVVGDNRYCIVNFWTASRIDSINQPVQQRHPDFKTSDTTLRRPGPRGFVEATSTKKRRKN